MTNQLRSKKTSYHYENKLTFQDRQRMAQLYLEGYAIFKIAIEYKVTPTTVQYHLRILNVYIENKRPTLWNRPIARRVPVLKETLTVKERVALELECDKHFPRNYAMYLKMDEQKRAFKKANECAAPKVSEHHNKADLPIQLPFSVTLKRHA